MTSHNHSRNGKAGTNNGRVNMSNAVRTPVSRSQRRGLPPNTGVALAGRAD